MIGLRKVRKANTIKEKMALKINAENKAKLIEMLDSNVTAEQESSRITTYYFNSFKNDFLKCHGTQSELSLSVSEYEIYANLIVTSTTAIEWSQNVTIAYTGQYTHDAFMRWLDFNVGKF